LAVSDQDLNFYDWKAKVLYRPSSRLFIKAGIFSNAQNFQYRFNIVDDPFISTDQIKERATAIQAKGTYAITDQWQSGFKIFHSGYNNTYDLIQEELGSVLTDYTELNDIYDRTYSLSNQVRLSSSWKVEGGYDFNIKRVNFALEGQIIDQAPSDFQKFSEGQFHNFFLSSNYTKKKFQFDAGIRSTRYTELQQWVHSPRFSLQYAIQDGLKIKSEGGIFHQFISQINEFGDNLIEVENPQYLPAYSTHAMDGYSTLTYIIITPQDSTRILRSSTH